MNDEFDNLINTLELIEMDKQELLQRNYKKIRRNKS